MAKPVDIIVRKEGEQFRVVPVSNSARILVSLKFTGTSEVLAESVVIDGDALCNLVRFCDLAGYGVWMP